MVNVHKQSYNAEGIWANRTWQPKKAVVAEARLNFGGVAAVAGFSPSYCTERLDQLGFDEAATTSEVIHMPITHQGAMYSRSDGSCSIFTAEHPIDLIHIYNHIGCTPYSRPEGG